MESCCARPQVFSNVSPSFSKRAWHQRVNNSFAPFFSAKYVRDRAPLHLRRCLEPACEPKALHCNQGSRNSSLLPSMVLRRILQAMPFSRSPTPNSNPRLRRNSQPSDLQQQAGCKAHPGNATRQLHTTTTNSSNLLANIMVFWPYLHACRRQRWWLYLTFVLQRKEVCEAL